MREWEPYARLAAYYDGGWSDYSQYAADLVERIQDESRRRFYSVCDAACGSGLLLQHLDDGLRTLAGYDRSEAMIGLAESRVPRGDFVVSDLRDAPPFSGPFELVTCMYDSLNYLLSSAELVRFFRGARSIVADDGVLVVDLNDTAMYADRDGSVHHRLIGGTGIRERLAYDPGPPAIATTTFEFPDGREVHRQRAWSTAEVEALIATAGWHLLDVLDAVDERTGESSGKVVYIALATP